MRLNGIQKFKFSGFLYTYTVTRDPEGGPIYTFTYGREIRLDIQSTSYGKLTIVLPDDSEDIIFGCRIHDIKDVSGRSLRPGGVWTVENSEVDLNMFGYREGYKARLNFLGLDGSIV